MFCDFRRFAMDARARNDGRLTWAFGSSVGTAPASSTNAAFHLLVDGDKAAKGHEQTTKAIHKWLKA